MTVEGLTPATTYHYRLVSTIGALDGPIVAVGADRTFTTAPLPSGGGSGGGSGSGGSVGGSGGGSGAVATPTIAPPTRVTRKAAVNARGSFAFAFTAGAGLRGSVRFTIPKHGRTKAIAFGARSFVVPSGGRVKLTIKLSSKSARAAAQASHAQGLA